MNYLLGLHAFAVDFLKEDWLKNRVVPLDSLTRCFITPSSTLVNVIFPQVSFNPLTLTYCPILNLRLTINNSHKHDLNNFWYRGEHDN